MKLDDLLKTHKEQLINQWIDRIQATYPLDTAGFLRSQKDPFHNPVGDKTEKAATALFGLLLADGITPEDAVPHLEDIIKIRAVQNFSPEQALAVLYFIKTIVRDTLGKQVEAEGLCTQLLAFESRIDTMTLIAFGIYVRCREKIQIMRTEEHKRHYAQLIRRAERILDTPAGKPDIR